MPGSTGPTGAWAMALDAPAVSTRTAVAAATAHAPNPGRRAGVACPQMLRGIFMSTSVFGRPTSGSAVLWFTDREAGSGRVDTDRLAGVAGDVAAAGSAPSGRFL